MSGRVPILFVDDDSRLLSAAKRALRKDFNIVTAEGGLAALTILEQRKDFAVIVSDQNMPGLKGDQFLAQVAKTHPKIVRIMLTGNNDLETSMRAINEGQIFRFLTKPCALDDFAVAIKDAIAQYQLQMAERELLEKTLSGSVKLLMEAIILSHPSTGVRLERVQGWARKLAPILDLPRPWEMTMSAMLWPLGELALPSTLLEKRDNNQALTNSEFQLVYQSPKVAWELVRNIPRLENVAQNILYSQAGYDGSGFPGDGVTGEDLPLCARILRVLIDLSSSLQSAPESAPLEALEMLNRKPKHYDPKIMAAIKTMLLEDSALTGGIATKPYEVNCTELAEGDVLLCPVKNREGKTLLAEGMELNAAMLEKLRQIKIISGIQEPIQVRRAVANAPMERKPLSA